MEKKYSSIHYNNYLELEKVLDAQQLRSAEFGKPAHDEMLFIIIHQVYELWFKEIIHDLTSVMKMFDTNEVEERNLGVAIARLNRITEIQKILVAQIDVLETMTSLDFLDFRNYLLPASGFQSFQFRIVEVALGLKKKERIAYTQDIYSSVFEKDQQETLKKMEDGMSMFQLAEQWLERIPFLQFDNFDFLKEYEQAVKDMLIEEKESITAADYISDKEKELRLRMLGDSDSYFATIFDEKAHNKKVESGELKLSYRATMSALLINLYRDEPILRQPYDFVGKLIEMDELFTTWRYRHAQMVMRILGKKIGTGGSSGHDYLKKTADNHRIFLDLHNISTLLIPRSYLPKLPESLKKKLDFVYSQSS